MKLLFDQNISHRIVAQLNDIFPNCSQVRFLSLENKTDIEIWNYAKSNNFSIVTFDADFYDFSILRGHPPKIVWLRTGNRNTKHIINLLLSKHDTITEFLLSENFKEISCLELNSQ